MARYRLLRSAFARGIRKFFRCALIGFGTLIFFIVNKGNIWTDGRRYRKRPLKIEM